MDTVKTLLLKGGGETRGQALKSRIALAEKREFDGLSSWGKKSQRIKPEKEEEAEDSTDFSRNVA